MLVLLDDEPTRITAYWIRHSHLFGKDEYECAACHKVSFEKQRVCPNCSAFMEDCIDDAKGKFKDWMNGPYYD